LVGFLVPNVANRRRQAVVVDAMMIYFNEERTYFKVDRMGFVGGCIPVQL